MFYKLLGMLVWRGAKWFLRRKYGAVASPSRSCSRRGLGAIVAGPPPALLTRRNCD